MVTFAEQRQLDNSARFDLEELAVPIVYNGVTIPAILEYGDDRRRLPNSAGAVAAEMIITVKRLDVSDVSKGIPVVIDNNQWQVWVEVGGDALNRRISLATRQAPIPYRSL